MPFDLQPLLDWIAANPRWAIAAVFTVALAESVVLVGLVVPGTLLMLAIGALIGIGAIDFWASAIAAAAGALAGDLLSYWLGRRYGQRLRGMWPFRRHANYLGLGEVFVRRHGGKSVLLARFVGPVRPIVPAVAGMLGMRPVPFLIADLAAALAWAPIYLLPGVAFGASLAIAQQVALRLSVLVLLVAAVALGAWLAVRWIFGAVHPRLQGLADRTVARLQARPAARRLLGGLIDPERPERLSLLTMGLLLLASGWAFFALLESVVTGDPLVDMDRSLHALLQELRTPWGDRMMVALTALGDGIVIGFVAGLVLLWLAWRRAGRAAAYWIGAVAFGQLASSMLKLAVQRPRPVLDVYEGVSAYAFPSGHATMSTVTYGFLAVLVASALPESRRWLVYWLAAVLVGTIALSRLYLGVHWLSDVLGGLALGTAWVTLLALAWHRHAVPAPPRGLASAALASLCIGVAVFLPWRFAADLARYAPTTSVVELPYAQWRDDQWRTLPVHRIDFGGDPEQPLNLQWAGDIDAVRARLLSLGWREPVATTPTSMLRWLASDPDPAALPLLPLLHRGREEALRLVREPGATAAPAELLVLRLWPSGRELQPGCQPLWIGTVSNAGLRSTPLFSFTITGDRFDDALAHLHGALRNGPEQVELRERRAGGAASGEDGPAVLLVSSRGRPTSPCRRRPDPRRHRAGRRRCGSRAPAGTCS